MNVPHLKEKLDMLLLRHDKITDRQKLADYLGVSTESIQVWISGQQGRRAPNQVPNKHVRKLRVLFGVVPEWLEEETVEEFQQLLDTRPLEHTSWKILCAEAALSDAIEIVRISDRGFIYEDQEKDKPPVEPLFEGEKVYIRFTLAKEWLDSGKAPHLVLLVEDQQAITCLCPSESQYAPRHEVTQQVVLFPRMAPRDHLTVTGPTGEQIILALLTRNALPETLYDELQAGNQEFLPALDWLATTVRSLDKGDWQFVKKICRVHPRS